jgi:CRP/FNR family transcriptional regulator, cyclic AMP receptor protein
MQTKKTLEQILAEHPFFQGFAPEQIQFLAGCAQNAHFKADTYLFREGEPASNFYILRGGKIALETHMPGPGMVTIETINAGEVVGWSWLFPPYTWHFSARALEDVQATVFDGGCLRGKAEQDHDLGYALVMKFAEVMMRRLQATRLQLLDMYSMK